MSPGGYSWSSPLFDFAIKECTWTDNTAQAGRTYYYKVKASFSNNDMTEPSNEVSFTSGQAGIVVTVNSPTAYVNGTAVTLEVPPALVDGRVLVPFRFLGESLGAQITWDQSTQKITAVFGGVTVILTVGAQTAIVNGADKEIDVPPQVVTGRTLVPLRFLTEAFHWQAKWDSSTLTATITSVPK